MNHANAEVDCLTGIVTSRATGENQVRTFWTGEER